MNETKFCVLMRGLPGSGKSSFAESLPGYTICSADKYFWKDGKYTFDGSKIGQAHAPCSEDFIKAVSEDKNIVIDNCNITKHNFNTYIQMAKRRGYIVITAITEDFDVMECFARNKHSVPYETINRYAKSFER